jgi:hypothetical protein
MSVKEYLLKDATPPVDGPTVAEVIARAQARKGGVSGEEIVRVIREGRDDPRPLRGEPGPRLQ